LGSSDTVKRRAEGVEGRLLIKGADSTPSAWLTTFKGDPLGTVRYFWDYRVLMPPSKVLIKIGIERHGQRRAEGVEGRLLIEGRLVIEGAAYTPSGWLTTFNGNPFGCFAPFGATEF
jgi:hypothetical protein